MFQGRACFGKCDKQIYGMTWTMEQAAEIKRSGYTEEAGPDAQGSGVGAHYEGPRILETHGF